MAKSKSRPQPHAERVLIQRTHYAGRDYITIRAWWSGENGKWYPSKNRGINLRADMFAPDAWRDLRRALRPPRRPDEPEVPAD